MANNHTRSSSASGSQWEDLKNLKVARIIEEEAHEFLCNTKISNGLR